MTARADLSFIEVRDYKAFEGTARLELAPLTVVFGRNGSGKSALVRLPALVGAALRPNADAEPGLPRSVRGMHFGSSLLSFCFGGVPGPEGVGLKVGLGAQVLEVQLGPQAGSPHAQPAQWIDSWVLREGDSEVCIDWNRKIRRYVQDQPVSVVFRGLVPVTAGPPVPLLAGLLAPHVEHIGPRRDLGEARFIPAEPRPVWDVGFTGADTARVLASLFNFNRQDIVDRIRETAETLLGVELKINSAQASGLGTTLEARRLSRDSWLQLGELGTGLAHALPVIVALATAGVAGPEDSPPSVLTIEEPEAHLHPEVHLKLADLLLQTARGGQTRCLVETHSETLILRLQRRVAEDPALAEQISLVWIDEEGGLTRPRVLRIHEDGSIPGWPDYWFDAAYRESMEIGRARLGGGRV